MSVRSAALQATCAALGFVVTMQSATAALHHAHKHHHRQGYFAMPPVGRQCGRDAACRSMVDTHVINGAESAPQVTSCTHELNPLQPVWSA